MKRSLNDIAVAPCSFQLRTDGYMQLTPAGRFRAKDGRPFGVPDWFINDQTAPKVLARLKARQDRIVVDYEHQTLNAEKNGQPAPAAAWFRGADVEWRSGEGLFVKPEYTEAAKARIEADEYKYTSPVIVYNKRTGEVLDIQMAALVNYAAIDGMKELDAVAAAKYSFTTEELPMEELMKLFGLAPDATEEQAIAALKALQAKATQLETQVGEKDAAITALKGQVESGGNPDPSKFVPIEVVAELQGEVATLKGRLDDGELEELVTQGIADGKIRGEKMEEWARSMGVEALKGYLGSAQAIAALKGSQTRGNPPKDVDSIELDDTDVAVCKQLGVGHDEFKATAAAAE